MIGQKIEAATWLIDCGAKIKIKNKEKKTPLDLALQTGYREMMNLLGNSEVRLEFNKFLDASAAAAAAALY